MGGVTNYFDAISTLLVAISAYLVYWQIKKSHEWNKKKTGEEALTRLTSGDLLKNIDLIKKEVGWDILTDAANYESIILEINEESKDKLDQYLTGIFRVLETTTIKIEHDIIDEKMCQDYLFSIITTIHKKCISFLLEAREKRGEPKLYEHVERYAIKWEKHHI